MSGVILWIYLLTLCAFSFCPFFWPTTNTEENTCNFKKTTTELVFSKLWSRQISFILEIFKNAIYPLSHIREWNKRWSTLIVLVKRIKIYITFPFPGQRFVCTVLEFQKVIYGAFVWRGVNLIQIQLHLLIIYFIMIISMSA